MNLVTMVWMKTTMKVLVAVRTIKLTMKMAVKLSKQSGYISSKSVTTRYQNELNNSCL